MDYKILQHEALELMQEFGATIKLERTRTIGDDPTDPHNEVSIHEAIGVFTNFNLSAIAGTGISVTDRRVLIARSSLDADLMTDIWKVWDHSNNILKVVNVRQVAPSTDAIIYELQARGGSVNLDQSA